MGLCFGTSRSRRPPPPPCWSPWSDDLPPELAGLIFSWLPSHADRLSFRAVCRQWRLAAVRQHPLPPALLWLLDLVYQRAYESLDAGGVVRSIPTGANRSLFCLSSYDGWLLHMVMGIPVPGDGSDHPPRYLVMNPFSQATMEIPCRFDLPIIDAFNKSLHDRHIIGDAWFTFFKIIVCSSDLVVAVVRPNKIVSFRPAIDPSWSVLSYDDEERIYEDIAFYRGKLYALTSKEELLVHEIRDNGSAKPLSRANHAIRVAGSPLTHLEDQQSNLNHFVRQYLVISCSGKLLMFRCTTNSNVSTVSSMMDISADVNHNGINFNVFEADLEKGQWVEVNNLDGQIIFLGKACSKAIRSLDHGDPRFRGNRIFLGAHLSLWWNRIQTSITSNSAYQERVPKYVVYDFRTSTSSRVSLRRHHQDPSIAQWFFPCM